MLVVLLAAVLAAPSTLPVLEPNGPWVVEAEENMCLLSRTFGAGPDAVTVGFQPMFAYPNMEVILLTHDSSSGSRVGSASLNFLPGNTSLHGDYVSVKLPGKDTRVTRITVDKEAFDTVATTETLRIDAGRVARSVHIVRFAKAMPAFSKCQDDLLRAWGVDPAVVTGPHAAKLESNPGRWFGPDNYPSEALDAGISGRSVAVLKVTDAGAVESCRTVATAGKILDDATCRQAMRIKFKPARDPDGKAVPTIYVLPVRWVAGF